MKGRIVFATTTLVARDEYTCEHINSWQLERNSMCSEFPLGVSPVRSFAKKVKYPDANWMP